MSLYAVWFWPRVNFSPPDGFERSREGIEGLMRLKVNIFEYVFLVRNLKEVDVEKNNNAPKKAQLYVEFDKITNLIQTRTKLISFLLFIMGNKKASEAFSELSELLDHMPSKNKLTQAYLLNHFVLPFKKIESLGKIV